MHISNRSTLWRGVLIITRGRSCMAIGTLIPTMPGRRGGCDEDNRQGRGAFIKRDRPGSKEHPPRVQISCCKTNPTPQHLLEYLPSRWDHPVDDLVH